MEEKSGYIFIINSLQNWFHFLFVLKATASKQQVSKFHPQVLSTDAIHHSFISQQRVINVGLKLTFVFIICG